jgi:uncharacterized protein YciU (UPF0263 family)
MINFNYETDFNLDKDDVAAWLGKVITSENKEGEINYVFATMNICIKLM